MAQKKVSRKKLLKEPDEFITTTGKMVQFFRGRQKQLSILGLIILAATAAGFGGYTYLRWQEEKAQVLQQQALQMYQEGVSKAPEADKEAYRKSLEKFREALGAYGRGQIGQLSHLYIAHCHYALKEYDQAIAAYSRCLDGPYRPIARDGLGHSFEAKGDYAKALEQYQKNMDDPQSPYQWEGILSVARSYEALNQKQKALEVYQKAMAKNPQQRTADFIRWKIGELKG